MRVVHLPYYDDNPYQALLFDALREQGVEPIDGGGGGNFLRSVLFRWRPAAVHLHWLHPYTVRQGLFASWLRLLQFILETSLIRLSGCRIIWTVHNLANHDGRHTRIERLAGRWLGTIASGVICHSNYAAKEVQRLCGIPAKRCQVVPHPNYISAESDIEVNHSQARHSRGIKDDTVVFLFLGRVAPYKGVESLIDAFRELDSPNTCLMIAGKPTDETYAGQLKRLAHGNEKIVFHSHFIDSRDMAELFTMADVVVFPFQDILTSGSLVLAMGYAKACIAPSFEALYEVLPDAQQPLTYEPGHQDGLLTSMRLAISETETLSKIGRNNRERVSGWTWQAMATACRTCYATGAAS